MKAVQLEKSVTILYAEDVRKSIAYFKEKLAFENNWVYDEKATFGGVSKGDVELFFCKNGQGHPGTWLCIIVDNVDQYYEQIKSLGAKILDGPVSQEWNMREMYVEVPDKHIIRFGQRINCD